MERRALLKQLMQEEFLLKVIRGKSWFCVDDPTIMSVLMAREDFTQK
jgi:hypothetical protein